MIYFFLYAEMTLPIDSRCNYVSPSEEINANHKSFNNKPFMCNKCGKQFSRKAGLTVHLNSHNTTNIPDDVQTNNEKETVNVCSICYKKFTAKKNLLKHLRDVHKNFKEAERMVVKKIKCPEASCNFICRMMKELRDHIEVCHKIKILKDTLEFPNESVFQAWKKEEESNTVSWFVTGRKKTTLIDGTKKQTLYCHRTGHYSPKGFGKYRMRSVGSCKIGVTCPAAMEVTEFSDGQLTVIYYKTHLGHLQDVVYLKLSREERTNLAEKIEQGFTFDSILEDVKESIDVKNMRKRIHLLSKKDLYSIMRSANDNQNKKIKNECDKKNKKPAADTREAKNTQDVVLQSLEMEKFSDSIQQNFTLYPGQGVILPQEFAGGDADSTMKLARTSNASQSEEGMSSQIVILSRDTDCPSVAEIILFSAGETVVQPRILPQNKILSVDGAKVEEKRSEISPELTLEEKSKLNRANLRLQLKEKLDQIIEFLPRSEFLTPKQFSLVSTKLNAVLNIFGVADNKAKIKINAKRKGSKRLMAEEIEKNGEKKTE